MRQAQKLSSEDVEDVFRVQVDQHEGERQQHQAGDDDLVQLLDGQRDVVVPVLLLELPLGLDLFRLFLGSNVFFFHYFLATYFRISMATATITTRPWTM